MWTENRLANGYRYSFPPTISGWEQQLEQYDYWQQHSPHQRRVASLAAIAEPIGDLVQTGRIGEWEAFVDPITDFVARGLLAPGG